jgi:hypothetical protein
MSRCRWGLHLQLLRLVVPGGIIVWHDYGVWEGVTRALEEIEGNHKIGLRHIRGTSLVFCKAGTRPAIT